MEIIEIFLGRDDILEEVAKATDYRGTKLMTEGDAGARDRVLAGDEDLKNLDRFWTEAELNVNENLKAMLLEGRSSDEGYRATLEVSLSFDKELTASVESMLRSFFIAYIIGQWFKLANRSEKDEYLEQAEGLMRAAERLLYSRVKPKRPSD